MKKLLTLSALSCLLLLAFSSCKDDDPNEGALNLKIDNSLITRPAKSDRYMIVAQDKLLVAQIESKTLSLPYGTYPMFVASNLKEYKFEGATFFMPLDKDGFINTDLKSEDFGTALDTVTVTNELSVVEVQLKPIDQMKLKVTLDQPERVKAITVKLSGVIQNFNYFTEKPVGEAGTIKREKTNISSSTTKDYSFEQMFLGYYPGATPGIEVTIDFNDTLDKYVYTASGGELDALTTVTIENERSYYEIVVPATFGTLE